MLRISQPQIHNVLKGKRKLTPDLADRVLRCFGMTILDLLDSSDLELQLANRQSEPPLPPDMQPAIAAHIEIVRVPVEPKIPRKGPDRQSSPDHFGSEKTA